MTIPAVVFDELDSTKTEKSCRAHLNEINKSAHLSNDVYGNGKGRTLLQDLAHCRKKIANLEDQLNAFVIRAGDGHLTEGTIATRRRYLHNFGSKILRRKRNPRRSVISRGNEAAHEGNIGLDIAVFQDQNPSPSGEDLLLFEKLYGISYDEAKELTSQCIS